jgi:hypothetical protein
MPLEVVPFEGQDPAVAEGDGYVPVVKIRAALGAPDIDDIGLDPDLVALPVDEFEDVQGRGDR